MFNIIVATCENMGIGMSGSLPWKLKKEMRYFAKMTKSTEDPTKKNAVIMGRKTYESIPSSFRPLKDRLNVVLTGQKEYNAGSEAVLVCHSLKEAMMKLKEKQGSLETLWIIGGASIYQEVMDSENLCNRIYLTKIQSNFECDTFLPNINVKKYKEVSDDRVDQEVQEENGLKFAYKVYERQIL